MKSPLSNKNNNTTTATTTKTNNNYNHYHNSQKNVMENNCMDTRSDKLRKYQIDWKNV